MQPFSMVNEQPNSLINRTIFLHHIKCFHDIKNEFFFQPMISSSLANFLNEKLAKGCAFRFAICLGQQPFQLMFDGKKIQPPIRR